MTVQLPGIRPAQPGHGGRRHRDALRAESPVTVGGWHLAETSDEMTVGTEWAPGELAHRRHAGWTHPSDPGHESPSPVTVPIRRMGPPQECAEQNWAKRSIVSGGE